VDPYAVLGVARHATADEVRRAWLALARRHHPDRGGDPATMQAVNEAWAIVGDPARRAMWDREHGATPRFVVPSAGAPDAASDGRDPEGFDPFDLLDDRPLAPPRRSGVDLAPVGLFALSVATGCVALALDEPAMLGLAGFLFFLSCIAVAAAALLTMRRSVRAGRR
jgi:hypothetical protein